VLPGSPPPSVAASAQPAADTAGYGRSANAAPQGSVGNGAAGDQASANLGVPNQGPTVVPPLPSPVTVR
jgi:hypothetical protein